MQPTTARGTIRVVLADDQPIYLEGLKLLLQQQKNIDIVGDVTTGNDLLEVVQKQKPSVVVTNVRLQEISGIEATRILVSRFPSLGVIAHTIFSEDSLLTAMMEAGARGYVLKNAKKEEIIQAVHQVSKQGNYFCPATASKLRELAIKNKLKGSTIKNKPHFTEKEISIIKLICRQCCNKEIADKLKLTCRSVVSTRERIQEKIGAVNMVGIVLYAVENGIHTIF